MDTNEAIKTLEQFERLDDYQVSEIVAVIRGQERMIKKLGEILADRRRRLYYTERNLSEAVKKNESHLAVVIASSEGGFAGFVPLLPGCITQGATIPETLEMLADAYKCWVEIANESGIDVPAAVRNHASS